MGLIICGIILFSLVLWITIDLNGKWFLKFLIILFSLGFSVYSGISIENFYGWPTIQSMPSESRVYWALVEDPRPDEGYPGAIFVWSAGSGEQSFSESYSKITFRGSRMSGVRAYKIKYSEAAKEAAIAVVQEIINGNVVIGSIPESGLDIPEEYLLGDNQESNEGREADGIRFYSLPPAGLTKE